MRLVRGLGLAGAVTFGLAGGAAHACDARVDCWTTTEGMTWHTTPTITIGSDHLSGCDSNERTPGEVVDCKLAYWQKELARLQKEHVDLDAKIAKAQERLEAFRAAGGHTAAKP